ncbi:MAG: hypothetical protein ABSH14_04600 [Verrucomicrobiia bacterium]
MSVCCTTFWKRFRRAPVDIAHAIVVTEESIAADVFFLQNPDGQKIRDAARLELIRTGVLAALG